MESTLSLMEQLPEDVGDGLSQDTQSALMRMLIVSAVNEVTGNDMGEDDMEIIRGECTGERVKSPYVQRLCRMKRGKFGQKARLKRCSKRKAPKF